MVQKIVFILLVTLIILTKSDWKSSIRWNRTIKRIINNVTLPPGTLAWTLKEHNKSPDDKAKLCLENIEKCYDEVHHSEFTTNHLSSYLLSKAPPLDLSHFANVSQTCRKQSQKYIQDLQKFKLWALQMYDSTAKLPSGFLNGNVNQMGDFDLCLKSHENEIKGQYCLASIQFETSKVTDSYLLALHRIIQSHFHFKSELDDPGHRVPQYSSVKWALCVPSGCSAKDVEIGVKKGLEELIKNTDFQFEVRVEEEMCQRKDVDREMPISTIIAIGVFAFAILAVLFAAVYDFTAVGTKNEWIMAFSLRKNYNSLISMKRSVDDIEAIHGIRFLNAAMLIFAHKSMAVFFNPYVNRTNMVELLAQPWTVIGRAASLYTDPFIMISGTLTAYALIGKLQKGQKISIFEEYVSRLLRIVPTFAALIAFCTLILPWLGSGPMWNMVVTHHSDICKKNWWRNLLFIHNYFGFKDMCLTHTHHVGIDSQLFFASPFLLALLWRWPRKGALILSLLAVLSTVMRYYVTYTLGLSNYVHFGTSIKQLFDTADKMYILPAHRATVYIMGLFLGYVLRNFRTVALTGFQHRLGGTLALLSFVVAFFGPAFMGSISYEYNATDAAFYAAFSPILWCFSFAWIIFTTHAGYKGPIENFFAWRGFTLWTKISYTVYLTQFPIFFFNVGTTRSSEYYSFFKTMFNIHEVVWILFLSTVLTLLFETPFQNIRNLIFNKKRETAIKTLIRKND